MAKMEQLLQDGATSRVSDTESVKPDLASFSFSQVHRSPKCDTHGHFCLIFGKIAISTNSSTLISKIIVAKLNSCVKMMFCGILL